jgi:hypothetical protein
MSTLIYEWIVLGKFADEIVNRISNRVIRYLRTITTTLSGDDSPLKNAWEEICVQVQYEQSIHWDAYLDTIDHAIQAEIAELQEHELAAIWFQTSEGEQWGFTDGNEREPLNLNEQEVIAVIRNAILSKAGDWSNARIRRWKEDLY